MKNIRILQSIFWFMLGGTVAVIVINLRVISANVGDVATPQGLAVYNLHDHVIPYLIFFIVCAAVSLLAMLTLKMKKPK